MHKEEALWRRCLNEKVDEDWNSCSVSPCYFNRVSFRFFALDLASYGATGSETLNPSGNSVGRALVVYDPGLSGAAKQDATRIANDLRTKGYTVDLAGVRSGTAGTMFDYEIIIAGGTIYFGQMTSSIDGYLKTLPSNTRKIGVFGSTGSSTFSQSDFNFDAKTGRLRFQELECNHKNDFGWQ